MSEQNYQRPESAETPPAPPTGYSQQTAPSGYPRTPAPSGYPQQPASSTYQTPPPPRQPGLSYGQQPQLQATPEPTPAKSGLLGTIALIVVLVCALVVAVLAWQVGSSMGEYFASTGTDIEAVDPEEMLNDPAFRGFVEAATAKLGLMTAAAGVGILGWIASIVATATRRGRAAGIFGIVLGVLAPIVGIVAYVAGIMSALMSMS